MWLYNRIAKLEYTRDLENHFTYNITHNFNGFLLNKVPLLQKLNLRESLSLKVLYGGLRKENNPAYHSNTYQFPVNANGMAATYTLGPTPYIEAGFGIGNIFKLIRVTAIKRFTYLDHPGTAPIGIRFSFTPDL